MKNNNKHNNTSNLIFSACLITAFVICSYFFERMITSSTNLNTTLKTLITDIIFVAFGLFLFYATRVGDGKQVKRFSLSTLLIMDLPALYIIVASVAKGLPFSEQVSSSSVIIMMAGIVLGYGLPYTFFSGYEIQSEETENKTGNTDDEQDLPYDVGDFEDTEENESSYNEKELSEEKDTLY